MCGVGVAGSQSPSLVAGIPGDGALEQEALEVDQVGAALVSGADEQAYSPE